MAKLSTNSIAPRTITRRETLAHFLCSRQGRKFFALLQSSRRSTENLELTFDRRVPVDDSQPEQLLKIRLALHTAHAKLELAEQSIRLMMITPAGVNGNRIGTRNSEQQSISPHPPAC